MGRDPKLTPNAKSMTHKEFLLRLDSFCQGSDVTDETKH